MYTEKNFYELMQFYSYLIITRQILSKLYFLISYIKPCLAKILVCQHQEIIFHFCFSYKYQSNKMIESMVHQSITKIR